MRGFREKSLDERVGEAGSRRGEGREGKVELYQKQVRGKER